MEEARKILEGILQEYLETHRHTHRQHSEEWHIAKKKTIGGSEMAVITGDNPYENLVGLVAKKLGYQPFIGDIKCQWGNMFEPVIQIYIEYDQSTKIMGEDLFLHNENNENSSYSPDGIGIITHDSVPKIALFEFKCPFQRIPNGKPPKYYIPQVKSGLDIIPITSVGLFAEAVFRRCSWSDIGFGMGYDRTLVDKTSGSCVLAYGFIGVFTTQKLTTYDKHFTTAGCLLDEINDLGICTPDLFTKTVDLIDCDKLQTWHSDMFIHKKQTTNTIDAELVKFDEFCTKHHSRRYGIIPWKLFRIDYHYITKEVGYVEKYREAIDRVITFVNKCNQMTPEDKLEAFEDFRISELSRKNYA